jgi:23S rRNA pseudouridine1911/1915/1917 synthase
MSAALEVLLCDNHLLAVAKPAGTPCVPDASGDESLLERAREWVRTSFEKPGRAWLGVVHRLDRPVTGIVLFARTSKAAARLSAALREGLFEKRYLGVGQGELAGDAHEGLLEQWLVKDPSTNLVRAVGGPRPGARLARTRWRVEARERKRTLLALEPETGRPHQLRVAAAALGAPLLGDLKYGATEPLPDRSIALHAARLVFPHPTRGERIELSLPPPAEPWWGIARAR